MTKRCCFAFLFCFLLSSNFAFAGGWIELSGSQKAYLAVPDWKEQEFFPVVILAHGPWGLDREIQRTADRLAEEGFIALAPDFYGGAVIGNEVEAYEKMQTLITEDVLYLLIETVDFAQDYPRSDPERIGMIGWANGGEFSLNYAVKDLRIRALVIYYGNIPAGEKTLEGLKIPLLGLYGKKDKSFTLRDVEALWFRLSQLHKRSTLHLYEKGRFGFDHPRQSGYDPLIAEDAWEKTRVFLKANLA
ncbi:MAG: dienelactone hydrolase family protein [Candidatus Omnitrophica bacterium]|nr:dienelactone hydrolase family protein [Candidatus Omnitrophota bacterium]